MDKAIIYGGQQITVSNEVADFLKQDNRRLQSQGRSDRRHLSKSDFETVLSSQLTPNRFALENNLYAYCKHLLIKHRYLNHL
jgi:pyridoxine 5'-phosphate synthase PdxJ